MLRRFLSQANYIILIGVLSSLIASLIVFLNAAVATFQEAWLLLTINGHQDHYEIHMIEIMDQFLIGTGFLVFALGLYDICIKPLPLPPALTFQTLHDVKSSLSNIIILAMTVTFLQKLETLENPLDTLFFGLAVSIVSAMLIGFKYFGGHTQTRPSSRQTDIHEP